MKAILQWVLKTMMKDQTGVMRTLPKKDLVDFNVAMTAERLARNGIDPNALKNANQVENAIRMIDDRPKVQEGITATKSAKVMDMKGKEIDPRSKIMGGTQSETEAEIAERLSRENKEGISRIRERQKMIDNAIDNQSPGFSGDRKVDAVLVAEEMAERMGKVYDNLPQEEQTKLYGEAFDALSKMRSDPGSGIMKATRAKPIEARADISKYIKDGKPDNDKLNALVDKDMILKEEADSLATKGENYERFQQISEERKNIREIIEDVRKMFPEDMAQGGRAGFKDGMTRRTFLKILGGAMAIPIIGRFLKPLKTAKGVTKVPIIKTDNVPGKPEWFDALVNKVIIEGDDVTKRFATGERQSIHQKTLDDGSVVRVTEDVDDGAVRVEYESDKNVFEDPVQMQYKKPLPDEGDPRPTAEFTTAESGPVGRQVGPDDYDIDVDEVGGTSIRDLDSDVSKLKEYATGKKPTMQELVQNIKRREKAAKITEGGDEMIDAVTRRQGDYDPSPEEFASGGIAGMLGE